MDYLKRVMKKYRNVVLAYAFMPLADGRNISVSISLSPSSHLYLEIGVNLQALGYNPYKIIPNFAELADRIAAENGYHTYIPSGQDYRAYGL